VEGDDSVYQSADGNTVVTSSHQMGKRLRHVLRLDLSKITSDPFKPAENVKVGMSTYVVFDLPPAGYTATEALAAHVGFAAMYNATSNLLISKLLAGEN
jgi:hypothetical protein